jgi:hypothetical protein
MSDQGSTDHEARYKLAGKKAKRRREVLHGAINDLENALAASQPGSERWIRDIQDALQRTQTTIENHVREAEAPDGMLAQVVQEEPALGARVEAMKREHVTMLERGAALVELSREPPSAEELQDKVTDIVELIDRHRHRSADLLLDAYDLDLSAGD